MLFQVRVYLRFAMIQTGGTKLNNVSRD